MQFSRFLTPARSCACAHVESKKRAFELISGLFTEAQPGLDTRLVFEALNARERIGNTAIHKGVAIPHGSISTITEPLAALLQLDTPVPYDAVDKQPVDLLFAVLLPADSANSHPQENTLLLKHIAWLTQQPAYCRQLRTANTHLALYERAVHFTPSENNNSPSRFNSSKEVMLRNF